MSIKRIAILKVNLYDFAKFYRKHRVSNICKLILQCIYNRKFFNLTFGKLSIFSLSILIFLNKLFKGYVLFLFYEFNLAVIYLKVYNLS